jgi:hypothetical protein
LCSGERPLSQAPAWDAFKGRILVVVALVALGVGIYQIQPPKPMYVGDVELQHPTD